MPEALTEAQMAQRRKELAEIAADREHYLAEHVQIGKQIVEEMLSTGQIGDNQPHSKMCTKGHIISAVYKGKAIVPTIVDSFRPIAYRKPIV